MLAQLTDDDKLQSRGNKMVGFKPEAKYQPFMYNGFHIQKKRCEDGYEYSRKPLTDDNMMRKTSYLPLGTLSLLLSDNIAFQNACDITWKKDHDKNEILILRLFSITQILVEKLAYKDESGFVTFHNDLGKINHWVNTIISDRLIPEFPRLNLGKRILNFEQGLINSIKNYI